MSQPGAYTYAPGSQAAATTTTANVQQTPQQVSIPVGIRAGADIKGEDDVDVTCPAVSGFVVGYFTWIFGIFLCCVGGDGRRTKFLRRGLTLGILAATIPIGAGLIYLIVSLTGNYYGYY